MSDTFQKFLTSSLIIALLLVVGCKKTTEPENNAPVISSVTVTPPSVVANGIALVNVTATDADGDALTYSYAPNGGAISGAGASVNWTAPGSAGAFSVVATVTDGQGGEAQSSGNLNVTMPAVVTSVTGTAFFPAGVNGNLYNSKVSLYATWDDWVTNTPVIHVATSGSGANVSFTITGINPGNYYLDVWKDNDNDGFWTVGDFVGWYGSGGLGSQNLSLLQVTEGNTVTVNVTMWILV